MLDEALAGLARDHTIMAPRNGERWNVQHACRLALTTPADLVLLWNGDVRLGYGDVSRLLDGYEAGARVVVGDRRSLTGRLLRPVVGTLLGVWRNDLDSPVRLYDADALGEIMSHVVVGTLLGVWRNDLDSPVRLYDADALGEIMSHVPRNSRHPTLLMSLVEHRLRFAAKEIRLRNAEQTPRDTDVATVLAEMLAGLGELWAFRSAARGVS